MSVRSMKHIWVFVTLFAAQTVRSGVVFGPDEEPKIEEPKIIISGEKAVTVIAAGISCGVVGQLFGIHKVTAATVMIGSTLCELLTENRSLQTCCVMGGYVLGAVLCNYLAAHSQQVRAIAL